MQFYTICITTLLLLAASLAIHYFTRMFIEYRKCLKEVRICAANRLRYIQILIEVVYTYKNQPSHMREHLLQEMTINKMLNYHIVDNCCNRIFAPDLKCTERDKLLYMLHKEGFSARELCIIFQLNNINSVYVKRHRINKLLDTVEEIPKKEN